jgi:hypothetical protein
MTLAVGGEIIGKARVMFRIGEADSEMSIHPKTKMN